MVRLTSSGTAADRQDIETPGTESHAHRGGLLRGRLAPRLFDYLRSSHVAPALTCLAAAFVLALKPVQPWHMKTGSWVYIPTSDALYYLMIAAQPYYSHSLFISDPAVPQGVTFYTWSLFVPPVLALRALGLKIFWFTLIWGLCAAIGMGLSSYILYWHFLRHRWIAATCAIFSLAYYGLCSIRPLLDQCRLFGSVLLHRINLLGPGTLGSLTPALLSVVHWLYSLGYWSAPRMQWHAPDPALELPLLFLHVVLVSVARERRSNRALAVSGLSFGVLFYVYFYAWTLAAAALCISFLLDRPARRVYVNTFVIGFVAGLPQLVRDVWVRHLASADALNRFLFYTGLPAHASISVPYGSILVLCGLGYWIWRERKYDLIYLWSLALGGVVLGRQGLVTGDFLHEYHWDWLWPPFRTILVIIVLAPLWRLVLQRRALAWATVLMVVAYAGLGPQVAGASFDPDLADAYVKYRAQRMEAPATPLARDSVIAGDVRFCELAAVAEDQRSLVFDFLASSMAVDDASWVAREALNGVLEGSSRAAFAHQARAMTDELWGAQPRRDAEDTALLRSFDEFSRDPTAAADSRNVRYVAIPEASPPPAYLRSGWSVFQAGPYWQVWERNRST
jgi:hypothetical protein